MRYGVLKGRINAFRRDDDTDPESLSGSIPPAEALTLVLQGDGALLGNDGGTITLLDPRGLKVDGVAYSRKDAQREGRPLVF
jgi:hypothetical protein